MVGQYYKWSEWRKWDLHVHTPESHWYRGNWEEFKKQIIESDCSVIWINDYFSVAGYKKLKQEIEEWSLNMGDKKIFPVVEMRMNQTLQKANKTNWVTHFNFHIIFDNNIKIDDIEIFLKSLKSEWTIIGTDYDDKNKLKDKKVSFDEVVQELQTDKKFTDKFLIWLPYDEYGGIWEIDPQSDGRIKWDFIKRAHILGSSNSAQIDFFLWRSPLDGNGHCKFSKENFHSWFGRKKPCIKWSDSHSSNDYIGNLKDEKSKPIEKFTWIKSNPTFEGLKQIIYEPEDRVCICKEPEILERVRNHQNQFIKNLSIQKIANKRVKNNWERFNDVNIVFNPGLTAIIWNKGSWKSAIADILWLGGSSRRSANFSFLSDERFLKKWFGDCFKWCLEWQDGNKNEFILSDKVDDNKPELIRYLPQSYFEGITNAVEAKEFKETLENIIFSHIPESDRLNKSNFQDLIRNKIESIERDLEWKYRKLKDVSQEIIKLEEQLHIKYKEKIENLLEEKKRELNAHKKNKENIKEPPLPSKVEETDEYKRQVIRINELSNNIQELVKKITDSKETLSKLKTDKDDLEHLLKDLERFENDVTEYKKDNKEIYNKFELDIDSIFILDINREKVQEKINTISNQIKNMDLLLYSLEEIDNQIIPVSEKEKLKENSLLVQKLNLENEKIEIQKVLSKPDKEYQEYRERLQMWEEKEKEIIWNEESPETIRYYESKLNYLENNLDNDLTNKREERVKISLEILKKKKEILQFYTELKKSVDEYIKQGKNFSATFHMNIEVELKKNNDFNESFLGFLNLNKKWSFRGSKQDWERILQELFEDKDLTNEDEMTKILNSILDLLENESNGERVEKRYISDQVKEGSIESFYEYIFSLKYLEPLYELKLNSVNISQLSPWERWTLLLVFYLSVDKETCPLVIDQPEDNLDNKSVFEILTLYLKNAKRKRQIIIVTHNPNLAVWADAEQIICVNIDKRNNYKFSYISGAIEAPEINNKIVEILEWTRPAFEQRKLKYI